MKVLVTGASGNVGRYVLESLSVKGENVIAAGKNVQKLKDLFPQHAEIVYFDFMNPATCQKALENVDRVFLMRPPHLGKPADMYPFIEAVNYSPLK